MALVGDSSGKMGRILGDSQDGSLTLVSSPSIEDPEVTAIIDDGEYGEIWIASGSIIDILDKGDNLWRAPINLEDSLNSQLEP